MHVICGVRAVAALVVFVIFVCLTVVIRRYSVLCKRLRLRLTLLLMLFLMMLLLLLCLFVRGLADKLAVCG